MPARKKTARVFKQEESGEPEVEKRTKGSPLEAKLAAQIDEAGLAGFVREYQFHPDRRWKVDFACPSRRIMVEVEGGLFGKPVICQNCHQPVMHTTKDGRRYPVREAGRHNTGVGFREDAEKYTTAMLDGWLVLRVPGDWVRNGTAIAIIKDAYEKWPKVIAGSMYWTVKDGVTR